MTGWINAGIVVGVLAGGLTFIGAWCAALVKAGRAVRRVSRFLDEFLGHDGEPGLVQRVDSLASTVDAMTVKVERIKAQVMPNGGSSLRDAVDQVRNELREHIRTANARADVA